MRGKFACFAGLFLLLLAVAVQADDSARLEDLSWEGTTLVLDLSAPCEYRTMTLDDPHRLVIDFPGTRSALRVHAFTGEGEVEGVRIGQNDEADASGVRCRVVLDMRSAPVFDIANAGGQYRVNFDYSGVRELSEGTSGVIETDADMAAKERSTYAESADAPVAPKTWTPVNVTPAPGRDVAAAERRAATSPDVAETPAEAVPLLRASSSEASLLGLNKDLKIPSREELQALARQVEGEREADDAADDTAAFDANLLFEEPQTEIEAQPETPDAEAEETVEETSLNTEDASDIYEVAAPSFSADRTPSTAEATVTTVEASVETEAQQTPPPLLLAGSGSLPTLPTLAERRAETSKTTPTPAQAASRTETEKTMPTPAQAAPRTVEPEFSQDMTEMTASAVANAQTSVAARPVLEEVSLESNPTIEKIARASQAAERAAAEKETRKKAPSRAEIAKALPVLAAGMAPTTGAVAAQASNAEARETETRQTETKPEKIVWENTDRKSAAPAAGVAVKVVNAQAGEAAGEVKATDEVARKVRLAVEKSANEFVKREMSDQRSLDDPITLEMRGAEFKTLLRAFSTFSGRNIISGREVSGPVSVQLKEVPWFEGLKAVCQANGFGVVEEYGMIRVASLSTINKETMDRLSSEKKRVEYAPLFTEVINLNFATAEDLRDPLQKMLSERGKIEMETRTNSLLITDIAENLEAIKRLAMELDKRMPQVEITARLVDIDYKASRDLGVAWEALNLASNSDIGVSGNAVVDGSFPNSTGTFQLGTIRNWGEFNVALQAMERDNTANIISNPRVMTMDNLEASILVGKKVPLIVADEAGNAVTQMTTVGIKLTVTPHINPDGQIMMQLATEVSDLSSEATVQGGVIITTHESKTNVMVDDGNTAVIAGLIRSSDTDLNLSVPLLSKIPLLGRFFGYQNDAKEKRELIIFITPRIVEGANLTGDIRFEDYDVEWPSSR